MKLQWKVTAAICFVFVAFGVVVFLLFNNLLLSEFQTLEDTQTRRNVSRVNEALQNEINSLVDRTWDWAVWDDAYRFVDDNYSEFIESNLTYDAVKSIAFDHIIFLNKDLKLSYGIEVDWDKEKVDKLSKEVKELLISNKLFSTVFETGEPLGGVMNFGGKRRMIAASPIFDSAQKEPQRGVLIFTRELTDDTLERFAKQTKLPFKLVNYSEGSGKDLVKLTPIGEAFSSPVLSTNTNQIDAETVVKDLLGYPIYKFLLSLPRDVYNQGLNMREFLGLCFLGMAAITAILLIGLVDKLVVSRIAVMSNELDIIARESRFMGRLTVKSNDELTTLGKRMNETLNALNEANKTAQEARNIADKANAAKSQFLAKVSHEIRTPLHSIMGMLRIVYRGEVDPNRRKYINLVRNSASTLLSIINDLLDFSKAETGMLQVSMEKCELRPILEGALSAISAKVYESGNVELLFDIGGNVPKNVNVDPHRLQQILINLLGNAAKFTEFGAVSLVAKFNPEEKRISIDVIDSGFGIPENQIDSIFKPFVQVDDKNLKAKGGTGLGLTITKQLIEGMNGTIGVTSKVGVGSTFTITLPVDEADIPQTVEADHVSSKKILLISNNPIVSNFYRDALANKGAIVSVAPRISNLAEILKGNHSIALDDSMLDDEKLFSIINEIQETAHIDRIIVLVNPLHLEIYSKLEAIGLKRLHWKPKLVSDLFLSIEKLHAQKKAMNDVDQTLTSSDKKLNILIADDMPTNIIILEELLREAGHSVTTVDNGQKLIDALGIGKSDKPAADFDLIFTDMQMPVLDGMEALKIIREQKEEKISKLPVILVTADGYEEEHHRMRAAGADDIIVKPFDISKLDRIIQIAAEKA